MVSTPGTIIQSSLTRSCNVSWATWTALSAFQMLTSEEGGKCLSQYCVFSFLLSAYVPAKSCTEPCETCRNVMIEVLHSRNLEKVREAIKKEAKL